VAESWSEAEDGEKVEGRVRMRVGLKKWLPLLIILAFMLIHAFGYTSWWWLFLEVPAVVFCPFLWWMQNDEEPRPYPGMYPGRPEWQRMVLWYIRNPLQNFGKYVVGVYDRNYTVVGDAPVLATAWNDLPDGRTGFKTTWLELKYVSLPFVSYVGKRVMWYAGWQWWGFFGLKFNILNSKIQVA